MLSNTNKTSLSNNGNNSVTPNLVSQTKYFTKSNNTKPEIFKINYTTSFNQIQLNNDSKPENNSNQANNNENNINPNQIKPITKLQPENKHSNNDNITFNNPGTIIVNNKVINNFSNNNISIDTKNKEFMSQIHGNLDENLKSMLYFSYDKFLNKDISEFTKTDNSIAETENYCNINSTNSNLAKRNYENQINFEDMETKFKQKIFK